MTEIFTARSGAPSLRINGTALHSAYDPEREARRFIEESLGSDVPSTIVVLGEGMGHFVKAASQRHPRATILAIFYSTEVFNATSPSSAFAWHPGSDVDIGTFLRSHIGELEIEGLRVLEWPVCARLFPETSRLVNAAVHQVVQESNGSFVTTVGAGRLWIRNALANFLAIDKPLVGRPCDPDRAIVIVAPGPTLEQAARPLAALRSRFDLWALPSSCVFLKDAGLEPDLVVMTDPGFYSIHHLQFASTPCPLAMPLSAARGTWNLAFHPYLLCQSDFAEKALLQAAGIKAPVVVPHGTVAATALDLALMATEGPVIFAGLDMSLRDIDAHARPSAFATLLHLNASRTNPHYSGSFHRAAAQRAEKPRDGGNARLSSSLRTYAGWFDALPATTLQRVFRLFPSHVSLRGLTPIDDVGIKSLLSQSAESRGVPRLAVPEGFPESAERRPIALRLLAGWHSQVTSTVSLDDFRKPASEMPPIISLLYMIAPRPLMEVRSLLRKGDEAGATQACARMRSGTAQFLLDLSRRVSDEG